MRHPLPDLQTASPAELNQMTALDVTHQLITGAASSETLVEACLARIAERDAAVGAWTYVDREQALAQARARDREPRRSPLHGIPIGVKDIFDTCDMPTAYGSPIHAGHRPANDSVVVALARRAGM